MAEAGEKFFILVDGEPYLTEIDALGVQRFIQNDVIRHLVDSEAIDLNKLYIDVLTQKLDAEDYIHFYMSMGFSVSGFNEKFGPGGSWEDNGRPPVEIYNPLWEDEKNGTKH